MKDSIAIGASVFSSPVGAGTLTGITDAGYPQVNHVAVTRLVHKTPEGQFLVYDAVDSYATGDWSMFIDDERAPGKGVSDSVVIVRSSEEAIEFCIAVKSLPKNIMFDHDLGGDDTSMRFIRWMTDQLLEDPPLFKLREDFEYSVHSQNPIGAKNIKGLMDQLIKHLKGN